MDKWLGKGGGGGVDSPHSALWATIRNFPRYHGTQACSFRRTLSENSQGQVHGPGTDLEVALFLFPLTSPVPEVANWVSFRLQLKSEVKKVGTLVLTLSAKMGHGEGARVGSVGTLHPCFA